MSLQYNRTFSQIFCACLITLGSISFTDSLFAQVPANAPSAKSLSVAESALPIGSTVVKVMSAESAIPFGVSIGAGNAAVLDMKGNDQEFARRFTFKNTSSGTYTINSIDFENKDNTFEFLSIESGESFPVEVPPGHSFTIRIAFHAKGRNILCSNILNFFTEESKMPLAFAIDAMQLPLSALPWNKKQAVAQAK